jgi:hypothetical protein
MRQYLLGPTNFAFLVYNELRVQVDTILTYESHDSSNHRGAHLYTSIAKVVF